MAIITISWKSRVKHGPPVAHLKRDTFTPRGQPALWVYVSSTHALKRPDLSALVSMASLLKMSTKYLKAKYNNS